jgi:hypothetical protein
MQVYVSVPLSKYAYVRRNIHICMHFGTYIERMLYTLLSHTIAHRYAYLCTQYMHSIHLYILHTHMIVTCI